MSLRLKILNCAYSFAAFDLYVLTTKCNRSYNFILYCFKEICWCWPPTTYCIL